MTTDPSPHLFWITSRAAGSVALVLSSLAVCAGLLMATKLVKGRGPDLRTAHEVLSLSTIVAVAVHGVVLVGDGFIKVSLPDVLIPFVGDYQPWWTSLGIVAGWGLVALGLSYYARGKIGVKRWRLLHRFTALAWLMGIVHSLGEGTDAGETWFLVMTGVAVVPPLLLLVYRLGSRGPAGDRPAAGRRNHDGRDHPARASAA